MIPRYIQIMLVLLLVSILVCGIYILQLRKRTQENLQRASDPVPVRPERAGTPQNIQLTIAYDDDGVFRSRRGSAVLPAETGERAKEILQTLVNQYLSKPSPHPLAEGSAVNNVFIVNTQKLAVVDLNEAFVDGHRSGIMVEDFTVASLIDTLAANLPQIQEVKILVDGKERETLAGHADLKSTYSTAAVHQVVAQLQ